MTPDFHSRHLAVVGGLGRLAGADLYSKLVKALALRGETDRYRLTLEQHGYQRPCGHHAEPADMGGRDLYLYDTLDALAPADGVLLPCFMSHTVIDALQAEVHVPIVNVMDALARHIDDSGRPAHLGILCTRYVRQQRLFERYFPDQALTYVSNDTHEHVVAPAVYGERGLMAGHMDGAVDKLRRACAELLRQGAEVIIPGTSEIAAVAHLLAQCGLPIVDTHQVYVDFALAHPEPHRARTFKLGIVGGIGPAATADFMQKIVRHTAAARDQDHIRLIVDHNPQIPDRTANLVANGTDPTLALYSACKRLEANGASAVAMPCNTAHAYVERIQAGLSTPIVNMLTETVRHIGAHCPGHDTVGLLATSGTIASRVYHDAARGSPFDVIVPDDAHQAEVMEAIYGSRGVKAGYTEGRCKESLLTALAHLARRGASVVILGCTELPLVLPEHPAFDVVGRTVVLLDPTAILARRCVALAGFTNARAAGRPANGAAAVP
jgi:aspartate racemase